MATYLTGSNSQPDSIRTLYLMNPGYTDYTDPSVQSNMALIIPTSTHGGQGSPLATKGHQLPQMIEFSHPSLLSQSSLANHGQESMVSGTNMEHESMNVFSARVDSHGYNWSGANEFSFLPSSGILGHGEFLAAGFNQVQQRTSDVPEYDLGNLMHSSFQGSTPLMHCNGMTLGLNMGSLQSSVGTGQTLSLSLFPQQSAMIQPLQLQGNGSALSSMANSGMKVRKSGSSASKCDLNSFGVSIGGGCPTQPTVLGNMGEGDSMNESQIRSFNSKYLKAAQELLIEAVSVGRALQDSPSSQAQLQSCTRPGSFSDSSSFAKEPHAAGTCVKDKEASNSLNDVKIVEGVANLPGLVANVILKNAGKVDLTPIPAEHQDLQMKKVKLMAMLDEVDQRYKQYYHQMQFVAASFETAAGFGAAKTYTTFALQTISKHFRCLRDAIAGQIKAACRTLGEDIVSALAPGETSVLRLVDQRLQQQRALRQLGMMQQHVWRPQRGLPEQSVSILRAWLFEHFLHPYPKDSDKILLARQTGLTRSQVSNWFINARVRLWKPMVEEMYQEETKVEEDGADQLQDMGSSHQDNEGDQLKKHPKLMDVGCLEQTQGMNGFWGQNDESKMNGFWGQNDESKRSLLTSAANSLLFHGKENTRDTDWKPLVEGLDSDIKMRAEDRFREHYNVSQDAIIEADHEKLTGECTFFQMNGINRYPQESLPAGYGGNSGVSLTLGLQQCEKLPLVQAQYNKQQVSMQRGQVDGGVDCYSANEGDYEIMSMQSRKQFPAHLLNQSFVS